MIESVISLLITLCVLAIAVYLVIWVLGAIGIVIPQKIVQLLWVIVILVAILFLFKMLAPHLGVHFMKALF